MLLSLIATVSGKVLPPVFNIVHYKLRITTVSVYLCVQTLSAHPSWSISGCGSGILVVSPSQKIKLYPDNPTHSHLYTIINTLHYVTLSYRRILGVARIQQLIFTRTFQHPVPATGPANNVLEDHA